MNSTSSSSRVYSLQSPQVLERVYESYKSENPRYLPQTRKTFQEAQKVCLDTIKGELPVPIYTASKSTQNTVNQTNCSSPREVWNALSPYQPPQLVLCSGGSWNAPVQKTREKAARAAYRSLAKTNRLFQKVFKRYPVDSDTHVMRVYIHTHNAENTSFWSKGSVWMGDCDRTLHKQQYYFQELYDHEFGHAVVESTANFNYQGQSGALNESMADMFGIVGKHYNNKTRNARGADWLFMDGWILRPDTSNGTACRSFIHPGQAYVDHPRLGDDPQVMHMNSFVKLPCDKKNDWGGVHINSGIPNHAFYLASVKIGGPTWEKPAQIWYNALLKGKSNYNFSNFAHATIKAAKELRYHEGVCNAVGQAWTQVGVNPEEWKSLSEEILDVLGAAAVGIFVFAGVVWTIDKLRGGGNSNSG